MKPVSSRAKFFHDNLSFSRRMFSMHLAAIALSLKYLSISLQIASGVPSGATIPVPLSPMVSFNPPTSVTIIGTTKW